MKIAFVSDAIYPYNKGGKETRLYEVSTRLAQRGHDVHIYCMNWFTRENEAVPSPPRGRLGWGWVSLPTKVEHNVTLHAICPYIPLYSGERRSIKQAILFGLSCFRLITESFDVVDVDSMPYFPIYAMRIVTWLKGKKLYATWHEVWGKEYWTSYLGWKGNFAYLIEKVSSLLPDQIIAVSQSTHDSISKEYGRTHNVSVIENGIDIEKIAKIPPAKKKYDVIYVGRLLKHKNVDVLLQSLAMLNKEKKKVTAVIIGIGPEEDNLKKLAKELGLTKSVTFLGHVPEYNNVIAQMKSSKVFVLPSTREGFGLVVLEANACGIPVITIEDINNSAKKLINHGINGYIVLLDINLLANAIEKLLLTKTISNNIIINSVRKYKWNRNIDKISYIYQYNNKSTV